MNGALLDAHKRDKPGTDTSVAKPLADLDIISLGPNLVNLLLFLLIPTDNGGSGYTDRAEALIDPVILFAAPLHTADDLFWRAAR